MSIALSDFVERERRCLPVPHFSFRDFDLNEPDSRGALRPALPSVWFEAGRRFGKSDRGN